MRRKWITIGCCLTNRTPGSFVCWPMIFAEYFSIWSPLQCIKQMDLGVTFFLFKVYFNCIFQPGRRGCWKCLYCDTKWLYCDTKWLHRDTKWLCCDTKWLYCDTKCLCCDTKWLYCDTKWLCCDTKWLYCDTKCLCCDTKWLYCDTKC